jgi:AcrR family transcriptional regulator
MARRADHSREELSELALAAARDLVAAEGLPALTARNVARAIGYSPGTLYNLFQDLDDLVMHLNGRTLDALDAILSQAPLTGRPEQDLGRLLELYLQFVRENGNLWAAIFDYNSAHGRGAPDWYLAKVAKLLALLEEALMPLFDESGREEAAGAARVLWASLHGICSLSQSDKLQVITDRSARELAEMLVHCLIAGLQKTRAS